MNQLKKDFSGYVPFSAEVNDGPQQAIMPSNRTIPANFAELMDLHDAAFVRAAYPIMLERFADPIGLNYYVSRLRNGYGRVSVLDQLARSDETSERWHTFPGTREAVMKFRMSRRLKGWKLALTDFEFGRTPSLRRLRALQNSVGGDRQRLEESVATLFRQQEVLNYLVSNLSITDATNEKSAAEKRNSGNSRAPLVPDIRSRRIDEVRLFDLPSAVRSAIDALRF